MAEAWGQGQCLETFLFLRHAANEQSPGHAPCSFCAEVSPEAKGNQQLSPAESFDVKGQTQKSIIILRLLPTGGEKPKPTITQTSHHLLK